MSGKKRNHVELCLGTSGTTLYPAAPVERIELAADSAVLLDFDGLLIDSETAGLRSWQEIYRRHECELDLAYWLSHVGAGDPCEPREQLLAAAGVVLDWETIEQERRRRRDELIVARPGAGALLTRAAELQIQCAITSNSPEWWIYEQMGNTGIDPTQFALVLSRDERRRKKPAPDVYCAALEALGVPPERAIAFEDSPHGVASAQAAGVFCVAVPNEVTQHLDLSKADLVVKSLNEVELVLTGL